MGLKQAFNNSDIVKSLKLVWASGKSYTYLLFLCQLSLSFLPIIQLYILKLIIDQVTEVDSFTFDQSLITYIIIFGLIQLVTAIISHFKELVSESQQQKVTDYISGLMIKKASLIDYSYYENPKFHDNLHLAQSQSLHKPNQILQNVSKLVQNLLLVGSICGLLFILHWGVAILLVCITFPIAYVKWTYAKKLHSWQVSKLNIERKAWYINYLLTAIEYAKEVRLFMLTPKLKKRYLKLRTQLFDEKYKIGFQKMISSIIARFVEIVAIISAYSFIIYRTINGLITIGDLVMYFQAFQKGQSALQQLMTSSIGIYSNRLFVSHLITILEMDNGDIKAENEKPSVPELNHSITFKNINFNYPSFTESVLKQINLTMNKGEIIAFVGENGSGKTTLIKLLCQLFKPQSGEILWDNKDISLYNKYSSWGRMSVIFQDFSKYEFSLSENIQMGDINADYEESKIWNALRKTDAETFTQNLPLQLDQQLGKTFQSGTDLSGGQWQKLALSRAFYKDADIIILDEPSSSIDPIAESHIFQEFKNIAKDKILILITHRLYNLALADKIYVFKDGHIVEEGNNDSLMQKEGEFKKMMALQTRQIYS